jgi:DNA (cytosine-5)-methyltransferase 1
VPRKLTVGSCFSGIGGLELGLEWTGGFETKWQIEWDEAASKVLEKHWPDVERKKDIRNVDFKQLQKVDVICGGFPCQDVSRAGKRAGITGDRSGLYVELLRAIRMVRPRFAIVENVAALINDGLDTVLGDLATQGNDTEWDCLSACELGAPHTRERVFILAYPNSDTRTQPIFRGNSEEVVERNKDEKKWGENRIVDQMGYKVAQGIRNGGGGVGIRTHVSSNG